MAGKNHVERSFLIQVDDSGGTARDLSTGLVRASISGIGLIYEEADMTGVSDGVVNFLTNHPSSTISATFHLDDTATTGAFTVLKGIEGGAAGTLTCQFGQSGAAPTSGDPEWEGEYIFTGMQVSFDGGKAVIAGTFVPGSATAPAWGTVA